MVAITNVLLFALGVSATAIRRATSPTTVQADISKLASDTSALATAIANWDGTLAGSAPIQKSEQALESDIDTAINNARGATVFSSTDSKTTINLVNTKLEPAVLSAVNNIITQKPKVQAAGLTTLIKNDLASLQNKTSTYTAVLISKASSDQQAAASSAAAKVKADITKAQNAYA